MKLEIYTDGNTLAARAAELFMESMQSSVRQRDRFTVALSGGHTPVAAHKAIANLGSPAHTPWRKTHVFWGDERCVPPDDEHSNERMARETLLSRVPIPEVQIHPMRCAGNTDAAARKYQDVLQDTFGSLPHFDLILMGMGADGHTASLFPGSPLLTETVRWVGGAHHAGDGFNRMTLTFPVINAADRVVFLVSGREKAEPLKRAISGDSGVPAGRVRPAGELYWLVDSAAASLLDRSIR